MASWHRRVGVRTALAIILTTITALTVFLYRESYGARASFCDDCAAETTVTETGTLRYADGHTIELRNRYHLLQQVKRIDDRLRITGLITGEIDRRLSAFLSHDRFDISIATDGIEDLCPQHLSPLYPASARRVLFLLPSGAVYAGKGWLGSFCDGRLSCRYRTEYITADGFEYTVACAGTLPDRTELRIMLRAFFDLERGWFRSVGGTVRSARETLESWWVIGEEMII
ncbi:MAG TPA: hypothetical protein PKH10_07975 [bacterium]|nr:hypothetical protein [bacterium]